MQNNPCVSAYGLFCFLVEIMEIIAGHTRLKAAEMLEMEEVPCIIADDSPEEQVQATLVYQIDL